MESPRTNRDLENRKIRYRTGLKIVRSKGKIYTYPRSANIPPRSGLDGWRMDAARRIHKTTSGRASHKGRTYVLSTTAIVEMLKNAKDRCQVTGMKFDYLPRTNRDWRTNPLAASLDRINNKGGYEPGNIRLVCACVNYAINEFGLELFEKMCLAFVGKHK